MTGHPSDRKLRAWLDGDAPELGEHIRECEVCLEQLEDLTALDPDVMSLLRRTVRPDPGFWDRLEAARRRRERTVESWSALVDLNSLGWRTWMTLLRDDDA